MSSAAAKPPAARREAPSVGSTGVAAGHPPGGGRAGFAASELARMAARLEEPSRVADQELVDADVSCGGEAASSEARSAECGFDWCGRRPATRGWVGGRSPTPTS